MRTVVYLVDNGSLRPEATLALRKLARAVGERSGQEVRPVSLLHAHKVDPAELGGRPATIVRRSLKTDLAAGVGRVLFLPLFLGPSRAITEYLPELIEEARGLRPDFEATTADPLAGSDPDRPDGRLAEILAAQVRAAAEAQGMERPKVALVDHGSPVEVVTRVRNAVAAQLRERLGASVEGVVACSMERRDGPDYAFNEPLLERVHEVEGFAGGDLLAAMFFLLPGRHAGPGGDVASILENLAGAGGYRKLGMTGLLGEHPLLVELLADRLRAAHGGEPEALGA